MWTREVVTAYDVNGSASAKETVDAKGERAAQLIDGNLKAGPAKIAAQYERGHKARCYAQTPDDAMSDAVAPALNADLLQASNGKHYRRNAQSAWTHEAGMTDTQDSKPRRMLRPNHNDRAHELQLMRDMQIINDQTMRALGPLPPGGVPVEVKRKPNFPKPVRAIQEPQAMTHPHDADTLSNGLPLPPIPQRLREMLKDYPGHLQQLQEDLNYALDGSRSARGTTNHVFEEMIWALEGCLDGFIREAKDELEAAQASGDAEAVARTEAKEHLMFRARSSNGGMNNLEEIWSYLEAHEEILK